MASLNEREFLEIVTNHHPNSFSIGVERLAREYDIGYTEAVIAYCDKYEIEMDMLVDSIEDVKTATLEELSTTKSEPMRRMTHSLEMRLPKRFQQMIDKIEI